MAKLYRFLSRLEVRWDVPAPLKKFTDGFVAFMTHPKPRAADRFNYGINVTAVSDDHAEIWVTFVFRNGHRYCCNASSCHHGLLSDFDFERLRQCFYEAGVHVPRPMLLHMNVVCEGGALFAVDPGDRPPQYEPVAKGWAHEEAYDESEAQITF